MKKALIVYICLFALSACKDDLTDINTNPKRPEVVPAETLFSSAEKNLSDAVASASVNSNIFRLLSQQWAQTTYTDESRYDLITRNIPQTFWNSIYRDVLMDLADAKKNLENADPKFTDPKVNTNKLALIELVTVYSYSIIVNTYGDAPYSEALNIDNVQPKYDDAATIYDDLLKRIDAALSKIDVSAEGFGDADLIYAGDMEQWVKFGNSLKLKLGMTLADVNPTKAKAAVEQAVPNVFTGNADNAAFQYLAAPPNTNPIWVDLVQSGRQDYVAANTLVDKMNALADPRRKFYFTTTQDGGFKGGTYGSSNSYSAFSQPGEMIVDPTFEALLLDYSEVEFYLAEAVERGFTVSGTAAEHYNNAITASIEYWGGTEQEAATYLAKPEVAYETAAENYKEKIGIQKWIALYNRGYDAWTEWRRLDYPELKAPESALSPIVPLRFTYPVQEQNLNTKNYNEAATAIGSDVVATKVFWDKF